jgi:hypothetical protein
MGSESPKKPALSQASKGLSTMSTETLDLNETINGTVTQNSNFQLVQPFKIENDSNNTLEVKPLSQTSSETLEIKPLSQTSSETLEIKPLSQTSSEMVEIKPLRVDNRQEVAYTDPIRTDSNSTVDLKPVAFDMCVRTGQASLPPTHVCEPYRHKIAITLMGLEMYGLELSGESQTIVDDRPGRKVIAGETLGAPPEHREVHHARRHHRNEGGMRIRLT